MKKVKIILVDDHSLIRHGIRTYLSDKPDEFEVIAEAHNGEEALHLAELHRPDVVLMDISMPGMNGMQTSEKMLALLPEVRILILSMHLDPQFIQECLTLGVQGYLFKSVGKEELQEAVRTIMEGDTYFSPEVREVVMQIYTHSLKKKKQDLSAPDFTLTNREKEVVQLLMDGKTSQEIADKLFISPRTVDTHRANLMQKFKTKNTIELIKKVNDFQLL
jgi:DNA-binding NarL/FixJ family response regulator